MWGVTKSLYDEGTVF